MNDSVQHMHGGRVLHVSPRHLTTSLSWLGAWCAARRAAIGGFEWSSWQRHVNDIQHIHALETVNSGITMSIKNASMLTPRTLLEMPAPRVSRTEPTTTLSKRRPVGEGGPGVGGSAAGKLPAGWMQLWSKTKNRPYYKNMVTNRCSWTLPGATAAPQLEPSGPGASDAAPATKRHAPSHMAEMPVVVTGLVSEGDLRDRADPMDMLDDSPKVFLRVNGQCFGHPGKACPSFLEPLLCEHRTQEEACNQVCTHSSSRSGGKEEEELVTEEAGPTCRDLNARVRTLESEMRRSDKKLSQVLDGQGALNVQLLDIQTKLARLLDRSQ